MKKTDPFLLVTIGIILTIAALAIGFSFFSPAPQTKFTAYSESENEKPKIETSLTDFDFGKINLSEIKTKDIILKNSGQKTLEVGNISTSCDCTKAQIIINQKESPVFTMHGENQWLGKIEPGKEGILKIIYEPAVHPVKGEIKRAVTLSTNDPLKPLLEFHFTAAVN